MNTGVQDTGEQDTVTPDTGEQDAGQQDAGQQDTSAGDGTGDGGTQPDTSPTCPGGAGCPCDANGDCDAGICLEGAEGKRCAQPCVDSCPTGFRCAQVPQGSDVVTVCVDAWARLCSPCSENKDCTHPGVVDARCVDRGATGTFCGAACKIDGDCPKGYACKNAKDLGGDVTSQGLPVDNAGALAGCACSTNAVSLGLKGTCSKAIVLGDEELSCAGELRCETAGAAAVCKANAPGQEACDGADNDCDGDTDESGCDDGNGCTIDSCEAGAKGKIACVNKVQPDGVGCDADGSVCTEGDACKGGKCVVGSVKSCDDGNPCTKDACDIAAGCTQTSDDGAPCDDDNPCTLGDVCAANNCKPGVPKLCDSGNSCVLAKCDLKTGKCAEDATDGAVCDDGDACSDKDACAKGTCRDSPRAATTPTPAPATAATGAKAACSRRRPTTTATPAPKATPAPRRRGPGKAVCACSKTATAKMTATCATARPSATSTRPSSARPTRRRWSPASRRRRLRAQHLRPGHGQVRAQGRGGRHLCSDGDACRRRRLQGGDLRGRRGGEV